MHNRKASKLLTIRFHSCKVYLKWPKVSDFELVSYISMYQNNLSNYSNS